MIKLALVGLSLLALEGLTTENFVVSAAAAEAGLILWLVKLLLGEKAEVIKTTAANTVATEKQNDLLKEQNALIREQDVLIKEQNVLIKEMTVKFEGLRIDVLNAKKGTS